MLNPHPQHYCTDTRGRAVPGHRRLAQGRAAELQPGWGQGPGRSFAWANYLFRPFVPCEPRQGATASELGGLQRRGEPGQGLQGRAAPGTQQGLQTPARGSGCPFPSKAGVCSPAETCRDLGWVSPPHGANPQASCPSWPSHPPPLHVLCMGKHPSPPHGCRRPAGSNPPIRQGKSAWDPPALGREGCAPPRGWRLLPSGARAMLFLRPGGCSLPELLQAATSFVHHPSSR